MKCTQLQNTFALINFETTNHSSIISEEFFRWKLIAQTEFPLLAMIRFRLRHNFHCRLQAFLTRTYSRKTVHTIIANSVSKLPLSLSTDMTQTEKNLSPGADNGNSMFVAETHSREISWWNVKIAIVSGEKPRTKPGKSVQLSADIDVERTRTDVIICESGIPHVEGSFLSWSCVEDLQWFPVFSSTWIDLTNNELIWNWIIFELDLNWI